MNSSGKTKCQRCGAEIPTTTPGQLCPACLMSGALEPPGDQTKTLSTPPGEFVSPRDPSDFPCDFGSYRLLGLLGRGGMGAVYEAEEIATGRRLALKMLGQQIDSPDMRQRFLREGRLAARVNHPNSLYIFGSEEIEGLPVITMEIAGGGTLKDELKKRGPLPVAEAVDAILDIIAGLESAHAAGVLHRDIKPSNCFVDPDGSVKVGDFGLSVSTLARADTFVTAYGQIMGTPAYASLEQLRGDKLDLRADIYSVGATLFTLLTNRAPFEGDNAVQVVANAVNQDPLPLTVLREEVPPGLERVVTRCLAKEPDGRFADYAALRNALLPFSSRVPEPASMVARIPAGWIDYLIAFLPMYVVLMFLVGGDKLLVQPLVERTLYSARYYFLLIGFGLLYFTVAEGIWGAGLGKWLRGLRVIGKNGRSPGLGRALIRNLIPILCVEGVRMPLMMALISDANWTGLHTALYVIAAIVCGCIPALLTLRASPENGYATGWDLASGTRVVVKPEGIVRPSLDLENGQEMPAASPDFLGPYQIIDELVPGAWLVATDPVLRRRVWLLRRTSAEVSLARRSVARAGRLRWLQSAKVDGATWDAFEATQGVPLASLVDEGKTVPWATLRHWLHDLASELWEAAGDYTLPAGLSLDQVWITADGRAILLDTAWPGDVAPTKCYPAGDLADQQRFLSAVAACVDPTSMPLHARPVLKNLEDGSFEKLSFLTGTLRGLLDRPAKVSKGMRAGSIFMLPLYIGIAFLVGRYNDKPWVSPEEMFITSTLVALGATALMQLLILPFRTSPGHAIFRLAVVDTRGELASLPRLLYRWAVVWLPLLLPLALLALLHQRAESLAFILGIVVVLLWIGAAVYAVIRPHCGLQDRRAGTRVVRR